jgi:putative transposase
MPKRKRLRFAASPKAQIVLEVIREEKGVAQIAAENSIHPNQIHKWKKQALEDFAQLFEDDRKGERVREAEHEKQRNELYAEIGRLSAQLSWLKKNLASNRSRLERLEKDNPEIPLKTQAELLGISYSNLFYEAVPPSERELAIKRRIDEIYTACPFYGSRKIAFLLRPEFGVSRPTVQAYTLAPGASAGVREMSIFAVVPGPNTSQSAPEHQIYPYLLRNVTAQHPNHIWGTDITYIRLAHGWLYLTAVLDWYSRYVISWALSQTLEMDFVLTAVNNALVQAKPEIKISMDGRDAPATTSSPNDYGVPSSTRKFIYMTMPARRAYHQLANYIHFYNFERPHQALDYLTPAQCYGVSPPAPFMVHSPLTLTNRTTLNRPIFNSKESYPPQSCLLFPLRL